ncbi:MAG TPA: extracellular solute-binding protein [Dongiaceae bacterium]|jgi:spermidine/putrescine transport system substrate-binding protein|nr:extracellular solute-binding protein [Dongiaceae bacterium]
MTEASKRRPAFGRSNRRDFLAGATALGVGAAVLGAPRIARAAGDVKVLNWQGYGTDEAWAVDAFHKATGNTVTHDYYNSESEMITKLRTNPGGYDVVLTNCAWNGLASKAGLLEPIDTSKMSNWADLNPAFRDSPLLNDGGKTYGAAWAWGITAIAYNTQIFSTAPDTIEVMWDPKLKKRVCMRDDAIEAVSFGAIATGQDMNHPQDLDKVKQKLLGLKDNVATLWSSEDEWDKQLAAKVFDISFYWSGSAFRAARAFKLPVGIFVPKEGAIGWFDGLAIAKGSPNPEGATAFINYMVDPSFFVKWFNDEGAAAPTNMKSTAALDDSNPAKAFYSDQEMVKRLQFMAPLTDDEKQKYSDLWTEVKTAYAG